MWRRIINNLGLTLTRSRLGLDYLQRSRRAHFLRDPSDNNYSRDKRRAYGSAGPTAAAYVAEA